MLYEVITGYYEVRALNGHAWSEAWIAPYGWVMFEATPGYQMNPQREEASPAKMIEGYLLTLENMNIADNGVVTVITSYSIHYTKLYEVEYIETGTAKTVERYIKTPNGTAYGFKPTPAQFFKMPKTRSRELKNLYFTGQWVISGGFSAAMMSGQYCAHTVIRITSYNVCYTKLLRSTHEIY